jgi:hypothetical protein
MNKLILAAAAFVSLAAVSAALPASAHVRYDDRRAVVAYDHRGDYRRDDHRRDYHRGWVYDRFHHRHWR